MVAVELVKHGRESRGEAPCIEEINGGPSRSDIQKFAIRSFPLSTATISAIVEPGDGHPVVFLHGNSSCKEIWTYQIDALRERGRAILAPDLPGHGQSENARTPSSTYSFPGYATVISRLLDALQWPSIDLVGWSLGGHIALQLLGTDPRIRSLLIVGTPPARPSVKALEDAFHASATMRLTGKKILSDSDALAYAASMLGEERCLTPHLMDNVRRTDGCARHFMFRNAMRGIGTDQRRVVETLDKPLCVVHGEREPFVRIDYLRSINYKCLWTNRIYVISDAGHAAHWQYPDEFNHILLSFLSDRPVSKMLPHDTEHRAQKNSCGRRGNHP